MTRLEKLDLDSSAARPDSRRDNLQPIEDLLAEIDATIQWVGEALPVLADTTLTEADVPLGRGQPPPESASMDGLCRVLSDEEAQEHDRALDQVREAALAAHDAGLWVLPPRADGSKAPEFEWKRYQTCRADREVVERWYNPRSRRTGVGILTGIGHEAFEFDDRDTYERFLAVIRQGH